MNDLIPLSKKTRVRVFISGQVQGVGYRYSTVHAAQRLKINGWVRNIQDGRVEAVFEGTKAAIDEMIQWCHQGPPAAVVKDVVVEQETPEGLQSFETRQ